MVRGCQSSARIAASVSWPSCAHQEPLRLKPESGRIGSISNAVQKQEDKTEGITQDKNSLRDSLEDQIRAVGDAIYAYASSAANYTLAAEVETKPSELDTMSEQRLDDVAQRIIDPGSANLAQLGPYNITQAKLDALDQARADFQRAKGKPRTKISEKAGYTGTLPQMIRDAKTLLRTRLDKLMTAFRLSDPAFFAGYLKCASRRGSSRAGRAGGAYNAGHMLIVSGASQ